MDAAIKRGSALMLVTCLAVLAVLLATAGTAAASQAEYDKAYRIGLAAYTYGLPLLDTDITFRTMTSIDVPKGAYGPVNHFNNVRKLNNPGEHGRRRPGRQLALVHRLGRPQAGAAGPARAAGGEPLLRPRASRPLHDQRPEPRAASTHPAGRLRPLRARPARPADPGGDVPHRRPVLAAVDHRVDPAQGQVGRQERQPHPGPLHADAAQQVRHRTIAEATGASAHRGRRPSGCPAACASSTRWAGNSSSSRRRRATALRSAGSPGSGSAPACG